MCNAAAVVVARSRSYTYILHILWCVIMCVWLDVSFAPRSGFTIHLHNEIKAVIFPRAYIHSICVLAVPVMVGYSTDPKIHGVAGIIAQIYIGACVDSIFFLLLC